MSWEATAWAKKTRGHKSHGAARLLLVIADYAEPKTHLAWPSQSSLAEDCEMSERNVRYCLESLVKQGFVKVVRKGNQHQPTLYQLAVAERCEPETSEEANIAGAEVNRKSEASEPEISSSEPEIAIADEPPSRAASIEPPVYVPEPMLESYRGQYEKAFEVMRQVTAWPNTREQAAHDWMLRDGIEIEHAYGAALALKSQYKPTKHKDLVATLVKWANNEKKWAAERSNGHAKSQANSRAVTSDWQNW